MDKENAVNTLSFDDYAYQQLKQAGITTYGGSVMRVAQKSSPYKLENIDVGGMFLSEHWRCVPEIIDYCNKLVYHGELQPQRKSGESCHLPRFGFAHVQGMSQRDNSASRYNEQEAQTVADWISKNKTRLINKSDEQCIEDIIAVVTPFREQKTIIKKILKGKNNGLDKITVGTVHALQGAERDVVIFSSVYDRNHTGSYFFDQDVMMLNVAVSRAKESFLVFGDMHIFDPNNTNDPSGLLATYLFEDSGNELVDIEPHKIIKNEQLDSEVSVERIAELKRHRKLLRYCFKSAQKHIIIASPFITDYAVQSDKIPELIRDAKNRGIKVTCYVDAFLNKDSKSQLKSSAKKGIVLLKEAGASVNVAQNFHNKTMCADHFLISEGSFNWLSAQRSKADKYQRYERSLVYWNKNNSHTETIEKLVTAFKRDMDKRVKASC
ncbi:hypothetical protein DYD21_01390 [Rhodohalobacter sp. SW132]|uniref:AAA domain-containing protein n=1 Tax=Rhodohalobacter sp. SW132 TaxID=2293433 RepID=UPI000E25526B|nr:AAA domain-containing protein [Rhodohalobacter sp. SW132]REL38631.1 hypothetical protein DYD21_01390 [Rhodohalobacter sp. SW132]